MLNGTLSVLKKKYFFCWAFSFALFTVHVVKNVQVTSTLAPQSILLQTYFVFKTISSIIVIRWYSAYGMFSRYHRAYQINQENVQKSLDKALFIFKKFQTPSPFYPP